GLAGAAELRAVDGLGARAGRLLGKVVRAAQRGERSAAVDDQAEKKNECDREHGADHRDRPGIVIAGGELAGSHGRLDHVSSGSVAEADSWRSVAPGRCRSCRTSVQLTAAVTVAGVPGGASKLPVTRTARRAQVMFCAARLTAASCSAASCASAWLRA